MFSGLRKVEQKIRRAIELQASQILQTGAVNLTDGGGNLLYTLDFSPKVEHFPTAGTSWASASLSQKISDLQDLATVIRSNGYASPDQLILGRSVLENLIGTEGFLERLDAARADLGTLTAGSTVGSGGTYHGTLKIGAYRYDVFTYDAEYEDPQTLASTPYLDPGKIVMRASSGRLDATFGGIPNIGQELGVTTRILPEMPSRLSSSAQRMDLFTNVWLSPDGEQLFGGVGTRPLMLPKAIDTFGCLDTQL
jgi:hypothetical protein